MFIWFVKSPEELVYNESAILCSKISLYFLDVVC